MSKTTLEDFKAYASYCSCIAFFNKPKVVDALMGFNQVVLRKV